MSMNIPTTTVAWALSLKLNDSPTTKLVLIALIVGQYRNTDAAVCGVMDALGMSERVVREHFRRLECHGLVKSCLIVVAD